MSQSSVTDENPFADEGPFASLSNDIQRDVTGLTFLGHLDQAVDYCGHTIVLRTLRVQDELQVARMTEQYMEGFGQVLAFAAATVAMAITSIDNRTDWVQPIGPNANALADAKFDYVTKNWYRTTIEHLFAEYEQLRGRQAQAIEAVQDLSKRSRTRSTPSLDSLKDRGVFQKPSEDITELLTD